MVAALATALLLQAVTLGGRVQSGVTVTPDTVTVGDPFTVVVRVRAPLGASIEFPQTPDSGGAVEALDPVQVVPSTDTLAVDQSAVYRMAAWDVGPFAIRFADVLVRERIGVRRIPITDVSVVVASVLPADSALRVPKPARAVYAFGPPWWVWLLLALAVAAIIALLWWLWKRRRHPVVAEDPFATAQRAFMRVDALGLVEAGERARYVALVVEILRDYLAAVVPPAQTSLTSVELLAALRDERAGSIQRLAALLAEADLVKFARRPVSAERALELGRDSRQIVERVHAARAAEAAAVEPDTLDRAA